MRALITGGAGFIGSYLVEMLLAQQFEVVVLDDLSTGRVQNLHCAKSNSNFKFHHVDVRDEALIAPHFHNVDWVLHLAAFADIVPSVQNPLLYLRAGVDGTISVLEAARLNGVSKFMYAASSSSYGLPKGEINNLSLENIGQKLFLEKESTLIIDSRKYDMYSSSEGKSNC